MPTITRRALLSSAMSAAVAPTLCRLATAQQRPAYKITDLEAWPKTDYSSAYDINNQGQIVGLASTGETIVSGLLRDTRAILWENGKFTDLVAQNYIAPHAFRINDHGQILIGFQYIGADSPGSVPPPEPYVVLWDRQKQTVWKMHDGFLPTNLNNNGQIAGYLTALSGAAALWNNGRAQALRMPAGVTTSHARAINDSGQIIGDLRPAHHEDEIPFLSIHDRCRIAAPAPSQVAFYTNAINARGVATGVFRESASRIAHAYLWSGGKLRDLGPLGINGSVRAINNQGEIVGRTDSGAFLYSNGKLLELNSLIPPGSNWHLVEATGINDKGQIVGNGQYQGQYRAFLLERDNAGVAATN